MGETLKDALRLYFNRKLKLEFRGAKVTSDGSLLAYRELDDALGLTSDVDSELRDIRIGKNTQHGLTTLLRQSRSVQEQVLEERRGIKKRVFMQISIKLLLKRNFLTVQNDFGGIIDVVHRKLCSLSIQMRNSR